MNVPASSMKCEGKQHMSASCQKYVEQRLFLVPIGALIGGTMYVGLVLCQEDDDDIQLNIYNRAELLLNSGVQQEPKSSTGTN